MFPFRGYRYAVAGARDISPVVAPPYDQISPETQERLLTMSAHNVVRVTLPREEPGLDRYDQARQVLEAWLAAGVWAPEEHPAIYPYHQTYAVQGRRITREGFVALGEVTDYAQGVVRPHERTHAGPKQDRLRLLEATGADMGLLFMLTADLDGALREAVRPHGEPVAQSHDLRGELHQLWRITDAATIARVQALMASRSVIIADGHHRYETAVEYARHHPRARLKLMTFCTLQAPGLTILANHRLVRGVDGFSLDQLAERARPWFETTALADPLRFTPTTRSIGVVSQARALVFRLRDEVVAKVPWPPDTSPAWRALAVSILHEGLLKPLLDITEAKLDARSHVDYTADAVEAVGRARAGHCQAAFLIAPTTADELRAVVEGGELLPQKSTHFYPKLLDGLVFHRLQQA
ncbi:MAG: DUF1015 domain-containing protein [Candidatus Rokuibacteriota bacterium]